MVLVKKIRRLLKQLMIRCGKNIVCIGFLVIFALNFSC